MDTKAREEYCIDEPECATDLEHILEWIRLLACHVRRHAAGIEKYHQVLKDKGEAELRLREFANWCESSAFNEREKAAFSLGESMSLRQFKELSPTVLKKAKCHFNRTEMVQLTLNILAVNDSINRESGSRARILVVEDDPNDQDLLRRQLETAQLKDNVVFVSDAHQAMAVMESYRRNPHDGELIALFLDLRLPGMSGIEFLRQIRAKPEMKDLPVIVMTSSNNPRDMEECQKLKVVSYVEKPITFSSFSKTVANFFQQIRTA